ncbi:MAG: hypothetical protein ABIH26_07375, partial [Candidatus Eisenbacteria bacterium]
LNRHGWPWFEAVAVRNEGVWETFRAATRALFESLEKSLGADPEKPEAAPAEAGSPRPPEKRFNPEAPVYDLGAAIDDVVRLSGTIGSWKGTVESNKKETEGGPARREPAGAPKPREARSEDVPKPSEKRAETPLDSKPLAAGRDSSPTRRTGADSPPPGSLPTLEGLVGSAERDPAADLPVAAGRPGAPSASASSGGRVPEREEGVVLRGRDAPAEAADSPSVVRIPVRLNEGEGVVRVEIVLQIRLGREEEKETAGASLDGRAGRS